MLLVPVGRLSGVLRDFLIDMPWPIPLPLIVDFVTVHHLEYFQRFEDSLSVVSVQFLLPSLTVDFFLLILLLLL